MDYSKQERRLELLEFKVIWWGNGGGEFNRLIFNLNLTEIYRTA